jgi:hypothetical protein
MTDSILETVRARLNGAGRHEWPAISEATKVPMGIIEKIAYGIERDYRLGNVEALLRHFDKQAA